MLQSILTLIAAIRTGDLWEIVKDVGALFLMIAALKPPVSQPHEMHATYNSYMTQNLDSLADSLQAYADAPTSIKWADLLSLLKAILAMAFKTLPA